MGAFFLRCPQQPRLLRLLSVNSWVSKTSQPLDQYPVTLHIEDMPFSQAFQLLPEDEGVFFFFPLKVVHGLGGYQETVLNYVLITTQLALQILGWGALRSLPSLA